MKSCSSYVIVFAFLAGVAPLVAQSYNLTDLGAAPGNTISQGYALNDLGQACGTSDSGVATATLFSGGQAFDLGSFVSGDVTVATGINDSIVVVGWERFASTATSHALIWSNGGIQDINSPSLFPGGTEAMAINDSGVVVGQGYLDNTGGSFHVFTYANGKMVDIGPPGAFQAVPVAINDSGEMIVSYATSKDNGQAIYSNGTFTKLVAPAGTSVRANAINNNGVIVGSIFYNTNSAVPHAALYSNGVWTDLGTLPGATRGTAAVGINTAGQIIATAAYQVTSYHPFIPAKTVACIIRNGVVVNLNTLIPTNSGFNLSRAIAINEAGQILCNTKTQSGVLVSNERAVLLTPK